MRYALAMGMRVDTRVMARVRLREMAREIEEVAVILEGAGYRMLPAELLKISRRLVEVREALFADGHDQLSGGSPRPA
jgi:hypothetical protein